MKQDKKDALFSGIGNYLVAEILYDAKISPYRTIGSLSDNEIKSLSHSIKYLTKLSYYNNNDGYMLSFGEYSKLHKKYIDDGILPVFHTDVKLDKNDEFKIKVYRQTKDPDGNTVEKDEDINKGRTFHWVKNVQV